MIIALRVFFALVLLGMVAVTSWAGGQTALWATPRPVAGHPWFLATLADAYAGFITFFAWVWYREPSARARTAWLVAILLLGNIAMATYGLVVTFRLPRTARATDVLLRGQPAPWWIPITLVGALALVSAIAAAI